MTEFQELQAHSWVEYGQFCLVLFNFEVVSSSVQGPKNLMFTFDIFASWHTVNLPFIIYLLHINLQKCWIQCDWWQNNPCQVQSSTTVIGKPRYITPNGVKIKFGEVKIKKEEQKSIKRRKLYTNCFYNPKPQLTIFM